MAVSPPVEIYLGAPLNKVMENFMFVRACYVLRKSRRSISFFAAGLTAVQNTTRSLPLPVLILFCLFAFTSGRVLAQATTFAGNAQHTSSYALPQKKKKKKKTTKINYKNPPLSHIMPPSFYTKKNGPGPKKTPSKGLGTLSTPTGHSISRTTPSTQISTLPRGPYPQERLPLALTMHCPAVRL